MGELQAEYGARVEFTIIPAEETARSFDKIEEYGFVDLKHGLVIFDADGTAVVKLPGHMFGRSEIDAGIQQVLED
ncbi:MAG: hypothetical protein KDC14_10290 [Planctomycetes bacterium]|nr:hypothetical protein [Planctomycetota bacterium]